MITLSAKINLLRGSSTDIIPKATTNSKNNISAKIEDIAGWKSQGGNPFLLGCSKLGTSTTFSQNLEYFIGNEIANENGIFAKPYKITIQNPKKRNITIVFDTYNNQFPTSIYVNGNLYENERTSFLIPVSENLETIQITIDNWNTPNMPLRLQGILVNVDIDIDKQNIISLGSNIDTRTDNKLPSWGIKSNSSQATFNDKTGEIIQYIEQGLLKKGLRVEIYLNNTITGHKNLVGIFKTTEWDYDNDNRNITVTYKDELEEWQDIIVPSLSTVVKRPNLLKLSVAFDYLYDFTQKMGYECAPFSFKGTPLENVWVSYLFIEEGNLWNCWDKLCQVAQLYIYIDYDGRVNFHHSSM